MADAVWDAIIVGGGASGMVAAIFSARAGKKVLVLEQKDVPCKKIHATGNGKCNFTNRNWEPEFFRSETPELVDRVTSQFSLTDTLSFFKEIGVFPKEKNGYYYPISEQAASVADSLLREAARLSVTIFTGKKVSKIKRNKHNIYEVFCENEKLYAQNVVLATGGKAAPVHGSDGSGYTLATDFGHSLVTPEPAIVQLKAKGNYFKTLAGVRLEGCVLLKCEEKEYRQSGELLFAAYGISGIPVMQLSRYAARALAAHKYVTAELDLFPILPADDLSHELLRRFQRMSQDSTEQAMVGLCNQKLNYVVLTRLNIDPVSKAALRTAADCDKIARMIKQFPMEITDTNGFENAQACSGGVSLTELNENCESRIKEGLFIIGELADVDGTCGGYNLQWAWSSGAVAGKAIGGKHASNITTETTN